VRATIACLALAMTGCFDVKVKVNSGQPKAKPQAEPLPAVASEWSTLKRRDRHEQREIVTPVLLAIWEDDFQLLEDLAESYRSEKTLRNDGGWALSTFYSAFEDYSDWNQLNAHVYYARLEQQMLKWRREFPDSPTSHVALGSFYVGYAWHARGADWAHTVSKEGWELFEERLQKAGDAVGDHQDIASKDPNYYRVLLRCATGEGWPLQAVTDTVKKAQAAFPEFWGVYYSGAYHQLPRWHGKDHAEWHIWLMERLADSSLTEEMQDEFYAQVVLRMLNFAYDESDEPNIFTEAGVDWDRLKRGCETLFSKYPKSSRLPSWYLRAADAAEEYETASSILERMNYQYDGHEWWGKGDSEFFRVVVRVEEAMAPAPTPGSPPEEGVE